MALARFKDLCIDAVDPPRLGEFWGTMLGLQYVEHDDGSVHLQGPTDQHTIWINAVPERKTVKNRVHLDVHAESISDFEAFGATVIDHASGYPWVVMGDPEGGEFCAFIRDERYDYRLYEVVVDSVDAEGTARWWADMLGAYALLDQQHRSAWIEGVPGMPFDCMVFVPVPEPKTVKNRVHWDVHTDDVDALVDAGATVLRPKGEDGLGWHVLADPEGNEFCAFTPD
ncbi:MAG TPA: VOC family protein [Nocardioidaceae bacterium]|nr:VOC family protein [Nocardioidaceae bacterium]